MNIKRIFEKIRHNHWLMMILCCAIPIILFIVAIYIFGLSKSYLFLLILLLCPVLHYFIMKDLHKKHTRR